MFIPEILCNNTITRHLIFFEFMLFINVAIMFYLFHTLGMENNKNN